MKREIEAGIGCGGAHDAGSVLVPGAAQHGFVVRCRPGTVTELKLWRSRICGAPQERCAASGTSEKRRSLAITLVAPPPIAARARRRGTRPPAFRGRGAPASLAACRLPRYGRAS